MSKTIRKEDIVKVLIEYKLGKSVSEIAKSTGLSRTTIHRYLNVFKEKFEPLPTRNLSEKEIEKLSKQAIKVRKSLLSENRNQSGRKVA